MAPSLPLDHPSCGGCGSGGDRLGPSRVLPSLRCAAVAMKILPSFTQGPADETAGPGHHHASLSLAWLWVQSVNKSCQWPVQSVSTLALFCEDPDPGCHCLTPAQWL